MRAGIVDALRRGRRIFAEGKPVLFGATAPTDTPLLDEQDLRELNRLSLESGRALTEWLSGEHAGRRKTQALEFSDYRGYVPGDDFRLIDWHVYARLGDLVVKTSQTQEVVTLSLLIDCSRSMDWGNPNRLRYAKRLTALLGGLALLQADMARVCSLGDGEAHTGSLLSGAGALRTLVEELDQLPVAATTDLARSLIAARQTMEPRGLVLLISDGLVPAEQLDALRALASDEAMVTMLHLVDDRESLPGTNGAVTLRDKETGAQLNLSLTPAMRTRYLERLSLHSADVAARCAASGVEYLQVRTSTAPIEVVAGLFREGSQ